MLFVERRYFILLFFVLAVSVFGALEKGPYLLFEGSNTSMTVMWQFSSTESSTITWGKTDSYELGSETTVEYGSDHQHKFRISDLEPETRYYYNVVGVGSGSFTTSPESSAGSVKLFAYGDTRTYPSDHNDVAGEIINQYTADATKRTAVIFSGDYVGTGSSESDWANTFFPRNQSNIVQLHKDIPNIGVIGNHEGTSGSSTLRKYYPFPHIDGHYWAFDYGPVRVYIIDEITKSFATGTAQYNWLQSDLATTDKEWKIAVIHSPGYSAGGGHANDQNVQQYLQPLFAEHGVDFVVTGDNHYYSRAVVNDVNHITTGGGGAPLYNPNSSASYIVKADKSNHFCEFDFRGGACTVTARRANGTIIETFDVIHETSVTITSPSMDTSLTTGDAITIDAQVVCAGTVSLTELLVDNVSVSTDNSEPYSFEWTPSSAGVYELSVRTTVGGTSYVSDIRTITVTNPIPEVVITNPVADTTVDINTSLGIDATVENLNLTVDSVLLIIDGERVESDLTLPYNFLWSSDLERSVQVSVDAWIDGAKYSSDSLTITVVDFSTKIFTDTFFVINENDDAEEGIGDINDTVFVDNPDLELVDDYDFMKDRQIVGIRFDKVTIPNTALVTGAWIQFVADESSDTVTSINFTGHNHDNSPTFQSVTGNISSRDKTVAEVNWVPEPWTAGDEGVDQKTPDLKSIVSEIIGRRAWSSGNSITFMVDGSGKRVATSFNTGGSSGASKLIISYKQGGSVSNNKTATLQDTRIAINRVSKTKIGFSITNSGNYKLKIFSLDGRTLYNRSGNFKEGAHNLLWNGSKLSKGIYLVSLEGANSKLTRKAVFK